MCKFYSHSFRGGTQIYPLEYELLSDMCDPSFHMNIFPIFVTPPFRDRRGASSQKTRQNHSSYPIRYGFRAGAEAIQYSLHIALVATFQFFFSVSLNSPLEFLSSEIHRSKVTIRQKNALERVNCNDVRARQNSLGNFS